MIEQITDLQFKRVCMFINEHRDLMKKLFNIKVNLSSLDLMRSDCSSHFIRMMDDMDIHHDWIQFEITETVATEYNAGLEMGNRWVYGCRGQTVSGYLVLDSKPEYSHETANFLPLR